MQKVDKMKERLKNLKENLLKVINANYNCSAVDNCDLIPATAANSADGLQ